MKHIEEYEEETSDTDTAAANTAAYNNREITMMDAANIMISIRNEPDHDDVNDVNDYDDDYDASSDSLPDYGHQCINPMSPVEKYIYRMDVYNVEQTIHYKTAYVIYDVTTRMYIVYAIVSNVYISETDTETYQQQQQQQSTTTASPRGGANDSVIRANLPIPRDTIQMKYSTSTVERVLNYIFTVIIPPVEYDYYIKDDIIGVVGGIDESAINRDTSFYDIERLIYDKTSKDTINGYKSFMLIPSRNFWYTPASSTACVASSQNKYTIQSADAILAIL